MSRDNIKKAIEITIKQVEIEYQKSQGMILTEDDLKSIIYQKLSKNCPKLTKPEQTEDSNIYASRLHTELSWYDKFGKLTIKPDLTILNTKYLNILHKNSERINLPSKGYSFRGDAVLMELKFIKNKTGIRPTTISGPLNNDVKKIKRLFQRLEEQGAPCDLFCYFIILNKTDTKCPEFEKFIEYVNSEAPGKYRMIYATGNIKFA